MSSTAFLHSNSRLRDARLLGLPLASTAAVIALTSFTAPAQAISFDWQFTNTFGSTTSGGTVKGTISGLLDNTPGQKTGLSVTVTSAPNPPGGGWINDWVYTAAPNATGFSVVNGVVTSANAVFLNSIKDDLAFGDGSDSNFFPVLSNFGSTIYNAYLGGTTTYIPQANPPSAVPGPLPILGAASALGWSRKVRSRLRSAQRSAV